MKQILTLALKMPGVVVDDHNMIVRIIRDLLKRIGFQDADVVSHGMRALEPLRFKSCGLIISDWNIG